MPERGEIPASEYEALSERYDALMKSSIEESIASQKKIDHLSTLREIALSINARIHLPEVLTEIANVVHGELEAKKLTLFQFESETNTVRPVAGKHGNDLITEERFEEEQTRVEGTAIGEALEHRRPVFVVSEYESVVYVPLIANNEALGVMQVVDRQDGRPFDQEDLPLLQDIGPMVAIAFNNARLYSQAVNDGLTKLYVRRYFDVKMAEMVEQAQRYGRMFSLMMFDIDHFKKFNDTYGHQTGDLVLQQFARLLQDNTRNSDVCCRYGGEEMTIILPETHLEKAAFLANKLCETIRNHRFGAEGGEALRVTTSIGVGQYGPELKSPETMVKAIDDALYRAKELGRNRVELAQTGT